MTRRAIWAALGGMAAALACVPALVPIRPALIWNATASTPVGLYAIRQVGVLHDGELVAAMPPEPIAGFLARGGFLPRGVPLLKHVVALASQTVCRADDTVTIDGIAAGIAFDRDHLGRPLPRWSGCRTLRPGEIFLMNASVPDSLDGRYFGPLPVTSIIGRATPLWLVAHPTAPVPPPMLAPPFSTTPQKDIHHDTDWHLHARCERLRWPRAYCCTRF